MEPLNPLYQRYLTILDIAFQPIVDIHSGDTFGVEALLRGTELLGFGSISAFFDHLFEKNILYSFDLALRKKVIEKFCLIDFHQKIKLFYNLDNRLIQMGDFSGGNTSRLLKHYNLDHKSIIFELSEHNEIIDIEQFANLMKHYRHEGFCIAIDDFGIGQSGYKMLYHTTPNLIKIDRFFIDNIDTDPKKKLLARQMVQLSTLIGCRIIAEGVEREEEFLLCKEIGCHLVQGYFIQHPSCTIENLYPKYTHIFTLSSMEKRLSGDQNILRKRLEVLQAVSVNDTMEALLIAFNKDHELSLVPIIDNQGIPLGIIHEHRLKAIIYSPFGQSLIKNNSSNFSLLETYIETIPIVDITMPLETIVELFSLHDHAPGVLVVESSKYIGYISARIMIEAVHERNLIRARDQNPLSRLPGNFMINEYIANAFDSQHSGAFCYFDFDHFKPYNDHYGFRNGDRIIILFAELMQKVLLNNYFIGHIGGDDFFAATAIPNETKFEEFSLLVQKLIQQFAQEVLEFYSVEDRHRESIIAEDRDGVVREFKLLRVSAVLVYKTPKSSIRSPEHLQKVFALEKKNAKKAPNNFCVIID
ncbi:MAG: EAL and GGDEF domain-containing protein [Sulfuricurvum sp.]|uniref:GGDEF domain-containing protein n=1 Tax=Sulfuricurvum sp. TaxID=2025608 RepID=UPI0026317185|nr:bifunctional diguanylate cyclase/phosphodiesterase [Sulfuricurvum sp.]MDD2828426.1 EAL and GGDEF domain-containing protein [Sulfuricurvum sp.]MDD4949431.1 EAL and GGDEF domain-containing protein [Sulfuricurvum sp.]